MNSKVGAFVLTSSFALAALLGACDTDSGLGTPCDSADDCDSGMICDVHDGQGTCQEDHGHDEHGEEHGEEHSEHGTDGEAACHMEDRDDEFALGLAKSGDIVTATFVSADPAPPALDDNTWVVAFTDETGAPLEGLEIVVTPTMPDHGHGTPVEALVTATDNPGEYEISPVNLFMAGYWEIAFDVTVGEDSDMLMFGFCVE